MPYSTPVMVRQALVPSSDGAIPDPPSNTAADFTDAQLNDAIAEADSIIDGYIGGAYAVPVQPVSGAIPHPIDFLSRNIAAYNATLSYRRSQDFADTDPVARRYIATMQLLVAVSKGTANLQIPNNTGGSSNAAAGAPLAGYIGNLFDVRDWDIRPMSPAWPAPVWDAGVFE